MDFTDTEGRHWSVRFSLFEMEEIQKNVGVNFSDLHKDGNALWDQLLQDTLLKGAVLWQCCKEQADKRNVTEREFLMSFNEDVLADAEEALLQAIIAFSRASKRPALKTLWEKTKQVRNLGLKIANREAEKLNTMPLEEMEADLEKRISTLSDTATNSEDRLESIREGSPSAS